MPFHLDEFNHTNFDKLTKLPATTPYLLDYVTEEYEAIISCPQPTLYGNSIDYNSDYFHNKRLKSEYHSNRSFSNNNSSGLPSPPLSSPERKLSFYNKPAAAQVTRPPTPPTTSSQPPSLRDYVESVVEKSKIDTGTLLLSLSYARRLKSKLSRTSKGMECTHHRIFLATLIIATKYIHDSALKNKYWVIYAQLFSACEINLMEKQLLQLLDYNLEIKANDYHTIVNDLVKLYFKNNYSSEVINNSMNDWQQPTTKVAPLKPSAISSLLNRYKPSPPPRHYKPLIDVSPPHCN